MFILWKNMLTLCNLVLVEGILLAHWIMQIFQDWHVLLYSIKNQLLHQLLVRPMWPPNMTPWHEYFKLNKSERWHVRVRVFFFYLLVCLTCCFSVNRWTETQCSTKAVRINVDLFWWFLPSSGRTSWASPEAGHNTLMWEVRSQCPEERHILISKDTGMPGVTRSVRPCEVSPSTKLSLSLSCDVFLRLSTVHSA